MFFADRKLAELKFHLLMNERLKHMVCWNGWSRDYGHWYFIECVQWKAEEVKRGVLVLHWQILLSLVMIDAGMEEEKALGIRSEQRVNLFLIMRGLFMHITDRSWLSQKCVAVW